jgi:hypothetical protein
VKVPFSARLSQRGEARRVNVVGDYGVVCDMGKLSRPGLVMITIGAVVVVLDFAARAAFPEQWGGENIGGGLLLLAAETVAVVGALVVAIQFLRTRSKK